MTVRAVVGAQWGDEGKGRVIDYLAHMQESIVIRFQGGDNAGHTVINDYGKNVLHLIPSGIFGPENLNIIGSGCVVNPASLLEEIAGLQKVGIACDNLRISHRAQMLMPYHRTLDELEEAARGKDTIGTTKRGVGPAYSDRATRSGLRIGDLLHPDWLEGRLDQAVSSLNRKLQLLGGDPVEVGEIYGLCMDYRDKIGKYIVDTTPIVREALENGTDILLEGQLGVMKDLDWGTYPYVTSSNPTAAFAPSGAGLPAQSLQEVVGVVKAYSTSVGDGPFPVELFDAAGEKLRDVGGEYGATTGRPRRCGWFDGVAISYAAWLNGMTSLAVTKLDVLDHFETIYVCTGYEMPDGSVVTNSLPDTPLLYDAKPIYEEWEGWKTSTEACRKWDELPAKAQAYVNRISELAGVPVQFIGVGPERSQMIVM